MRVRREQKKDRELLQLISYLDDKQITEDVVESKKILNAAGLGYFMVNGLLHYESADTIYWKEKIGCACTLLGGSLG